MWRKKKTKYMYLFKKNENEFKWVYFNTLGWGNYSFICKSTIYHKSWVVHLGWILGNLVKNMFICIKERELCKNTVFIHLFIFQSRITFFMQNSFPGRIPVTIYVRSVYVYVLHTYLCVKFIIKLFSFLSTLLCKVFCVYVSQFCLGQQYRLKHSMMLVYRNSQSLL